MICLYTQAGFFEGCMTSVFLHICKHLVGWSLPFTWLLIWAMTLLFTHDISKVRLNTFLAQNSIECFVDSPGDPMGQLLLTHPCLSPTSSTSVGWIPGFLEAAFSKYKLQSKSNTPYFFYVVSVIPKQSCKHVLLMRNGTHGSVLAKGNVFQARFGDKVL